MFGKQRRGMLLLSSALGVIVMFGSGALANAADPTYQFNIPAESLSQALTDFSQASSQQIIYSEDLVRGRSSSGLRGSYTPSAALSALLAGTDLRVETNPSGVLMVRPKKAQAALDDGAAIPTDAVEAVTVTGSRIKGETPSAHVITITQQQTLEAGQYNLGDVIRSLPQNFSGGQNPGVQLGATGSSVNNVNISGGSAVNLRGLGPDATLTLLNGRRLAYDSFSQGVDMSAIPLAAVDRIEAVMDGASAIYGSDAVAGVVNVVLKKDFDGLAATARLGTATGGGDFQQQYSIVGGKTWATGGFIGAYNFERDTAISANQRDGTSYLSDPYMLLPQLTDQSVLVSGHQDISSYVTFSVDALYNDRHSYNVATTSLQAQDRVHDVNYVLSPTLTVRLPEGWTASLSGLYGRDTVHGVSDDYISGIPLLHTDFCYCNTAGSVDLDVAGALWEMPAGDLKVAFGGGYRRNSLKDVTYSDGTLNYGMRHSYSGYAEVFVPLVSRSMNVPIVSALSLDGAIRYEDYSDFGSITTPKVGLTYAPVDDVDFKASWGKSFKAPTLEQEYSSKYIYLYPAEELGGVGYPATATALYANGGNPDLKPERATTWTVSGALHPGWFPGFDAELSYFNIGYTSRVVVPISPATSAFSDPQFQQFITANPSVALQQKVIAGASGGLFNLTSGSYDPSDVVAYVDNLYTNIAAQKIDGVDLSVSYTLDLGGDRYTLKSDTSWLNSSQRNNGLATSYDLAGTVFNPPHLRSRTGLSWARGAFQVQLFYNFTGGVRDTRYTPNPNGDPMQSVDLTLNYSAGESSGILRDTDFSVAVQNLTDEAPPFLRNAQAYYVNYDSTNYSAIGRFVSVSVTRHW